MKHEAPEYAVLFNRDGEDLCGIFIRDAVVREMIGEAPEIRITGTLERENRANRLTRKPDRSMTPKALVFNPPATIVLWKDGTKTVVKCDDSDRYVPITGLALCYMKKSLGNTSRELNKALREAERAFKSEILRRKEK